jgi:hypothetical protein
MDDREEQLRTKLLEAILNYLDGDKTFRSVLTLGITAYNQRQPKNPAIAEVLSQLNAMGNHIAIGNNYSREDIKEIFTTMLEKLIGD